MKKFPVLGIDGPEDVDEPEGVRAGSFGGRGPGFRRGMSPRGGRFFEDPSEERLVAADVTVLSSVGVTSSLSPLSDKDRD